MSALEQPRDVRGRYAESARTDAPVALMISDEDYNRDGTYAYPPEPRSGAQVVAFWERVHVPEVVLRQMQIAFADKQKLVRAEALKPWQRDHPEPAKYPKWGRKPVEATKEWTAWTEAREQENQRIESAHPSYIPNTYARSIARAAGMARQATALRRSDDEWGTDGAQVVWQHKIDMGISGEHTVAQLLQWYPVLELPRETFLDRTAETSAWATTELLNRLDDPQ